MMLAVDFVTAFLAMLAQAADDVFDIDDRIVDHDADGDHKPGQDHRVERRPGEIQHEQPATSESGIASRLINAVRHSKRKATRISITSRQPMSSAV